MTRSRANLGFEWEQNLRKHWRSEGSEHVKERKRKCTVREDEAVSKTFERRMRTQETA